MSIADLQTKFNLFIRLRDAAPHSGMGHCITCNVPVFYKNADAGHFMPSSHGGTRFDQQNVNLQCRSCNSDPTGSHALYAIALDKKFGEGTAEGLRIKAHVFSKWGKIERDTLNEWLNEQIKKIRKEKIL